ncbi:MAG TPA: UbiA family prenyltransferase [Anaerolineales bacterium]|nr:UbiA family prenyltransferase [Anaerolineales bacterium]
MRVIPQARSRLALYWPLLKSLQTGLLLATGMAGYLSAHTPVSGMAWAGLCVTLFLAISGSTILNMWYDHDIDARMERTHNRPTASGSLSQREVLRLGLVLACVGVGGALVMHRMYGLVVLAGLFFDVVVYTLWLKRRTCWSIVWGGIAGAMPILSGRVLAMGRVDFIGVLLALSVLLWIPTHILTFSLRYEADYRRAGVPTFPSTYDRITTRRIIALSAVLAAVAIGWASVLIGVQAGYLRLIAVLAAGLLLLALATFRLQSERMSFGLFKYASLYMLSSMIILSMQALA